MVQVLERVSDGRLELHGVAGTLYGPLSVQRLVYREAGRDVIVESLELEWSPRALLAATVRVDRLAAQSLTLKLTAGGATAAAPPASLRVPIRVALQDLRIDRLVVDDGKAPLEFAPVAGAVTLGLTRHTLTLGALGTPWARVDGEVSIGAWAPFRLRGRVGLRALGTLPLEAADLTLTGNASRVEIAAAPKATWFAGSAKATITPFATSPLQGLSLALREVNLAGLDPALPATRARLDTVLVGKDGVLSGPVAVKNALAGRIDSGRIPLSAASGTARFDGARLRVDDLKLSLAQAGSAAGWAEVSLEGYAMELATDGLRLEELHGALRPLRPAGTVRIAREADAQRVDARLKAGDYALELSARCSRARIDVDAATLRMPGGEVAATGEVLLNETQTFKFDARLKEFRSGPVRRHAGGTTERNRAGTRCAATRLAGGDRLPNRHGALRRGSAEWRGEMVAAQRTRQRCRRHHLRWARIACVRTAGAVQPAIG